MLQSLYFCGPRQGNALVFKNISTSFKFNQPQYDVTCRSSAMPFDLIDDEELAIEAAWPADKVRKISSIYLKRKIQSQDGEVICVDNSGQLTSKSSPDDERVLVYFEGLCNFCNEKNVAENDMYGDIRKIVNAVIKQNFVGQLYERKQRKLELPRHLQDYVLDEVGQKFIILDSCFNCNGFLGVVIEVKANEIDNDRLRQLHAYIAIANEANKVKFFGFDYITASQKEEALLGQLGILKEKIKAVPDMEEKLQSQIVKVEILKNKIKLQKSVQGRDARIEESKLANELVEAQAKVVHFEELTYKKQKYPSGFIL